MPVCIYFPNLVSIRKAGSCWGLLIPWGIFKNAHLGHRGIVSAKFSAGLEPGEPCLVLAQLCCALEYLLMSHVRRSRKEVNVQTASVFKHWVNREQREISAVSCTEQHQAWVRFLSHYLGSFSEIHLMFFASLTQFCRSSQFYMKHLSFFQSLFIVRSDISPLLPFFATRGRNNPFTSSITISCIITF